jgi:ABC-type multidrug transport system permease subunit
MIKQIIYEIWKNFNLIFRNKSSLVLLIIGPLSLILLTGFAFSGDKVHDIKIGVFANNYDMISPFLEGIGKSGSIVRYESVKNCIDDMKIERVHICIEIIGSLSLNNETSKLIFYYDNTRKKLTSVLLSEIGEYLGVTSEEISIEATSGIFKNIETMVVFLNERNDDISSLVDESTNFRNDLVTRKARLMNLRDAYLPKYYFIKMLQSDISNVSNSTNASLQKADQLLAEISLLKDNFSNQYGTIINNSTINYSNSSVFLDSFYANFSDASGYMISLEGEGLNSTKNVYDKITQINRETEQTIEQLDEFKVMLDEEIENIDNYLLAVDVSVARVTDMQEKLNANLVDLSKLNPSLAEKLIRPILKSYDPLISDLRDINIIFPSLLALIILFISLLFSNIVTTSELSSKAYLRNLIAPVNDLVFTTGLIITNLLITLLQVFVFLMVAQFRFKIDIIYNLPNILLVCVLFSLIFIFLGMAIAYLCRNEQTSILVTTFVSIGFFLFSDSITPLETMPVLASTIAGLNPYVMAQAVFKRLIIFRLPFKIILNEFLILASFCLFTLIGLIVISKIKNRERL